MDVAAIAGLLAVGYLLSRGQAKQEQAEGFESHTDSDRSMPDLANGGLPPPIYTDARTPPNQATVPGKPRTPYRTADDNLDLFYNLPSGGSLPSQPYLQEDLYARSLVYQNPPPVAPPRPNQAVTAQVRVNTDGVEAPPVYNSGKTIISPLSGLPMTPDEFTHNNMVPYFRGSAKQNMRDDIHRQTLDNYTGAGSTVISKREMAPLFEPTREPMGNPNGLESVTDFMQDRIVAPTNRANETPIEPTMVGRGIAQGYSSFPVGGFQQFEVLEVAKQRATIDELRAESNPRVTYETPVVAGKWVNSMPALTGEVRKYRPDKFWLNEEGERNLVTVGENSRPTERPAIVMPGQQRADTSKEIFGPASMAESKQTYNVPSFRAPLANQFDGYGYRNADGSTYGVRNTDATNNDFGKAAYDLPTNQRNVTGERNQGLNLTTAGVPKGLTVYDPNDVARTTVRETTGASDYAGIAGLGSAPQKLTVYDPLDVTRATQRNTMAEPDKMLNVTRSGVPGAATLPMQDGMRLTTRLNTSQSYGGSAALATGKFGQSYDGAYNMRQNPNKELLSAGRQPVAGAGLLSLFNGEDSVNITTLRKVEADYINDRDNTVDRVVGPPVGIEAIGIQRPRQPLKLDISVDRNIHEILDTLNDNPYALPVHRIAAGLAGPAELAAATMGGGYVMGGVKSYAHS
jgi:hypothetical protein